MNVISYQLEFIAAILVGVCELHFELLGAENLNFVFIVVRLLMKVKWFDVDDFQDLAFLLLCEAWRLLGKVDNLNVGTFKFLVETRERLNFNASFRAF